MQLGQFGGAMGSMCMQRDRISALALALASLTSWTCGPAIALTPHFEEDILHHAGATNQVDRKGERASERAKQTCDLVLMQVPYYLSSFFMTNNWSGKDPSCGYPRTPTARMTPRRLEYRVN